MVGMEAIDPVELIAGIPRIVLGSAGRGELLLALDGLRRIRNRIDACEVAIAAPIDDIFPGTGT